MVFSRQTVKFTENERVDLPDVQALTSLRDDELAIYVRGLLSEVSAGSGLVLRGFSGASGGGLLFNIASAISVAIDNDGNLVTRDAAGTVGLSLTPNTTNYIMLYYIPTDSDSDARRFIDSVTGVETVQTVATRISKFAGFFVNTSGFVSSAIIGGATRKLIPLYTVLTGAATITTITDSRPLWGDPGTGETTAQNVTLALTDVRLWLRDICAKIKGVTGAALYSSAPVRTIAAIDAEIVAARGSLGSVDARLDVQHNNNGTHSAITSTGLTNSGNISNTGTFSSGTSAALPFLINAFGAATAQNSLTTRLLNFAGSGTTGGDSMYGFRDYDSIAWTPGLLMSGSNFFNYESRFGRAWRINNMIFFNISISFFSGTGGAGSFTGTPYITGFPVAINTFSSFANYLAEGFWTVANIQGANQLYGMKLVYDGGNGSSSMAVYTRDSINGNSWGPAQAGSLFSFGSPSGFIQRWQFRGMYPCV